MALMAPRGKVPKDRSWKAAKTFMGKDLDANLRKLTTRFKKTTAGKVCCQDEVTRTNRTIELANRLVKGLEVPVPLTEGLDPVGMLTDNATVAAWNNEGMPSDRMSVENATILTVVEAKENEIKINEARKKLGFTIDLGKLHNVSLGQGQEVVAEKALEKASREGHWVILQGELTVSSEIEALQSAL
ncbi:UNVERIFIED_CONTAM: hypothetical protein FKN15_074178 [Acipenser sinensis]